MWQEAIVLLIGITTAGYVGCRIFRIIKTGKRPSSSPCDGCSGCSSKSCRTD
ncbi:MAG: FeoB-associated Cys-rich membrane protein [Tannerellaceae bacterium]|nr:FeoB-associated Cys-rich membrane protein [Tannerellaceae bacterium]